MQGRTPVKAAWVPEFVPEIVMVWFGVATTVLTDPIFGAASEEPPRKIRASIDVARAAIRTTDAMEIVR